ncbi:MAG: hypothetical protein Q9188_006642 [Gyalolechia gomerana]
MDNDEPEGGDQQRELPLAIQANRYPAEDAAYRGREEQANDIEANEQINVQLNGQSDAQPNGTQPNMGSQKDAPPSGQQSADREEVSVDPKESLEPFAWDDLEARFVRKMEECERREEEIEREFGEWCLVFKAWASTTREHEEERAHKRLTKSTSTIYTSLKLTPHKTDIRVVQAFESALALLAGP